LQPKCHAKVDAELLKSQAAERRAEKEKAAERRASKRRACTKKRTYDEILSDEEDELNDTCHEVSSDRIPVEYESDADEHDDDEVFEVFECPDCGEHGCDCPPRYVGAYRERERKREKENAAYDCSTVCTKELLSAFSPHRNGPPWRRRRGLMQRHCGAANKEATLYNFISPPLYNI
jgi:hypothetical protein